MMQGIELGHYDGALLIGYHAGATALGGTLAHTVSGDLFQEIRLNGIAVSEAGISAAIAGHFGVPVLMVAGDDVAVDETRRLLGDIASACLKTSYGFMSAINPSPANADLRLREAVRDALALIGTVRPYTLTGPVVVDVKLRARFTAEWLSYLQDVEQRDAFTIRYPARDMVAVSRFIQFITSARAALS
jgi:D-amino peptidase